MGKQLATFFKLGAFAFRGIHHGLFDATEFLHGRE